MAVYPIVFRKAFGRKAGLIASALALTVPATFLALLLLLGVVGVPIPVMVAIGPLVVTQYFWWRRSRPERTTVEYLLAEPTTRRVARQS